MRYLVMASVYKDARSASNDLRSRACDFDCYTPEREIFAESLDDVADLFLEKFGDDLDMLCGHSYLYAKNGNDWQRITD